MVNENSLVNADIVDRSPQATDQSLKLEKTTSPRSPQTQKCDIKLEEINDDNRQIHTIYQFQNCGTVNLSIDSFNASGVRMENCGNIVPQVTKCSSFLSLIARFSGRFCSHAISYYQITGLVAMRRVMKIHIHNPMASLLMVCRHLPSH